MIPRNEDLPAGAPMVFACVDCGTPFWVPECYLAKPDRCPNCGGEWSEGPYGGELVTTVPMDDPDTAALAEFWARCEEASRTFPLYMLDAERNVQPATMQQWLNCKMDFERFCRVASDYVGKVWVSTAFLGLDMNHSRVMRPELPTLTFETLIQWPEGSEIFDRYSTWAEAEAGHAEALKAVREKLN